MVEILFMDFPRLKELSVPALFRRPFGRVQRNPVWGDQKLLRGVAARTGERELFSV